MTQLVALHRTIRYGMRCAGAALLLALAAPAHGYFEHFLQGTIVGTLDKNQTAALMSTFGKTLSESPDGASVPFQLPADARGRTTEGTFTPLTTRTENGQRCRKIRSELSRAGKSERWLGWYCQQANGEWKKTLLKD